MARHKVEVFDQSNWNALYNLNNKLVMDNTANGMMIFKDVEWIEEEETYGRRKNKTRTRYYIECEVLGYNRNGKFIGAFDKNTVGRILLMNDLYKMRRIYLDHIDALEAMKVLEAKLNERPVIDQAIQCLKEGKVLEATKIYKKGTGKSLKEAKDYVCDVLKPQYYREPNNQ